MEVIAARTAETATVLLEMPEPSPPAAGQVLCETLQLGVCGTDREILETGTPHVPDGDDFLALGHECLGRIVPGPRCSLGNATLEPGSRIFDRGKAGAGYHERP